MKKTSTGKEIENLNLPARVRTIQTINEKNLRYRYWTSDQTRKNSRNRLDCKRRKDATKSSLDTGTRSNTTT